MVQILAARFARCASLGCLCLIVALVCLAAPCAGDPSAPLFRIGFSETSFSDLNQNDAIAAVRVWAQVAVRERGIPAEPQPIIFRDITEISAALANKTVDCISMTTVEYDALQEQLADDSVIVGVISGSIMEEYVLLVRRDSGIESVRDLKGHTFGMFDSPRASLAPVWLDTLLAREGLAPAADFFGRIVSVTKIGKAVLPVFFRRLDACVVTRKGFDTMIELNPQTGRQLKALAVSTAVVPNVFCFRAGYSASLRQKFMDEMVRWHHFPAGRQTLTIFQTDRVEEQPVSCLASALELLAENKRLRGGAKVRPAQKSPGGVSGGKK